MAQSFYLQLDAEAIHPELKKSITKKGLKGTARILLATDPQDPSKEIFVLKFNNLRPE